MPTLHFWYPLFLILFFLVIVLRWWAVQGSGPNGGESLAGQALHVLTCAKRTVSYASSMASNLSAPTMSWTRPLQLPRPRHPLQSPARYSPTRPHSATSACSTNACSSSTSPSSGSSTIPSLRAPRPRHSAPPGLSGIPLFRWCSLPRMGSCLAHGRSYLNS